MKNKIAQILVIISFFWSSQSIAAPVAIGPVNGVTTVTGTISYIELTQVTVHGFNGHSNQFTAITFDDGSIVKYYNWPKIPVKIGNKYKFTIHGGSIDRVEEIN